MPVKSTTEPAIVAGALAARVREGAEVCLSAIGVDAVSNAMRAICFARLYLEVQRYFSSCNAVCTKFNTVTWYQQNSVLGCPTFVPF